MADLEWQDKRILLLDEWNILDVPFKLWLYENHNPVIKGIYGDYSVRLKAYPTAAFCSRTNINLTTISTNKFGEDFSILYEEGIKEEISYSIKFFFSHTQEGQKYVNRYLSRRRWK